jgi:hypothetical protein
MSAAKAGMLTPIAISATLPRTRFFIAPPEDVFLTQGVHWWLSLNYEAFW